MVLEFGGKRIAFVGNDLVAVTQELTQKVRTDVERATGIPGERVFVNTTQTHSGPASRTWLGETELGEIDKSYLSDLHLKIASAIITASQKLQPVTMSYGEAPVEGVARNREYEGGPIDKNVKVIKFMHRNQLLGFAAYYSVHPNILGRGSTLISGDLVAVATNKVVSDYPGSVGIFLQGSTGDQSPLYSGLPAEEGLIKLEQLSNLLADGIRRALQNASPVRVDSVDMKARGINLPTVPPDQSLVVLRLLDAERWLKRTDIPEDLRGEFLFQRDSARAVLDRFNQGPLAQTSCEIQVARMGDVLILGHPFELFIKLGNQMVELLPGYKVLVTSGTGDTLEYMPTEDKFDVQLTRGERYSYSFSAYQVPWQNGEFPFRPDAGDILVQEMVKLARDVISERER